MKEKIQQVRLRKAELHCWNISGKVYLTAEKFNQTHTVVIHDVGHIKLDIRSSVSCNDDVSVDIFDLFCPLAATHALCTSKENWGEKINYS